MALDKSITNGKEHRRKYIGVKAIDKNCRNHGSCPWCLGNRIYGNKRRLEKAINELKENNYN